MFESMFSPITEVIDVYCNENRNVGNTCRRVNVCNSPRGTPIAVISVMCVSSQALSQSPVSGARWSGFSLNR